MRGKETAASFQYENTQSPLRQTLSQDSAADSGTDHDDIVKLVFVRSLTKQHSLDISVLDDDASMQTWKTHDVIIERNVERTSRKDERCGTHRHPSIQQEARFDRFKAKVQGKFEAPAVAFI